MPVDSTPPDDFGLDRALDPKDAIEKDRLNRGGFAKQLVNALKPLSPRSSIVVSIEGAWGSGKSSILAMAEELLAQEADKPVIVHFNPWLIGDRNALLQQFLSSLSKSLELVDVPGVAKRVAETIEKYSSVLKLGKFVPIPGAETVASVGKAIADGVAQAAKASASSEPHNIEAQKRKVEEALKEFPKRVVVLIDDMDRLYPAEVFEVIRIIKAVADLPNVGYILAFDAPYITEALSALHVPKADAYLDKIVQTRLAIPVLSSRAKQDLMLAGYSQLPPEATMSYFEKAQDQLASIYHAGLRDILEQPRDFARLYNVVNSLEPELRGEIALPDIIGLAALMTKASPVFELLKKSPQAFVGRLPHEIFSPSSDEVIKEYKDARSKSYEKCASPRAVRQLVHFLFPQIAKDEGHPHVMRSSSWRGRLAHSARLVVALQFALTAADVSFRQIRRFIEDPQTLNDVAATLTQENCQDFLELVADSVGYYQDLSEQHARALVIAVARLVETTAFVEARRNRNGLLQVPAENTAILAIRKLATTRGSEFIQQAARDVACDQQALTVAADLALAKRDEGESADDFFLADQDLDGSRSAFVDNVLRSIADGHFFDKLNPGRILWSLSLAVPQRCPDVMSALRQKDPLLDDFALAFFASAFDSSKGQQYSVARLLPTLTAFDKVETFEAHAKQRLDDPQVQYPLRAAWRCVIEGKALYGIDGSDAR